MPTFLADLLTAAFPIVRRGFEPYKHALEHRKKAIPGKPEDEQNPSTSRMRPHRETAIPGQLVEEQSLHASPHDQEHHRSMAVPNQLVEEHTLHAAPPAADPQFLHANEPPEEAKPETAEAPSALEREPKRRRLHAKDPPRSRKRKSQSSRDNRTEQQTRPKDPHPTADRKNKATKPKPVPRSGANIITPAEPVPSFRFGPQYRIIKPRMLTHKVEYGGKWHDRSLEDSQGRLHLPGEYSIELAKKVDEKVPDCRVYAGVKRRREDGSQMQDGPGEHNKSKDNRYWKAYAALAAQGGLYRSLDFSRPPTSLASVSRAHVDQLRMPERRVGVQAQASAPLVQPHIQYQLASSSQHVSPPVAQQPLQRVPPPVIQAGTPAQPLAPQIGPPAPAQPLTPPPPPPTRPLAPLVQLNSPHVAQQTRQHISRPTIHAGSPPAPAPTQPLAPPVKPPAPAPQVRSPAPAQSLAPPAQSPQSSPSAEPLAPPMKQPSPLVAQQTPQHTSRPAIHAGSPLVPAPTQPLAPLVKPPPPAPQVGSPAPAQSPQSPPSAEPLAPPMNQPSPLEAKQPTPHAPQLVIQTDSPSVQPLLPQQPLAEGTRSPAPTHPLAALIQPSVQQQVQCPSPVHQTSAGVQPSQPAQPITVDQIQQGPELPSLSQQTSASDEDVEMTVRCRALKLFNTKSKVIQYDVNLSKVKNYEISQNSPE